MFLTHKSSEEFYTNYLLNIFVQVLRRIWSDHIVSWEEIVSSGHHCILTKVGISLVGDPIVGLVEKPDGGLAMESYV